MKEKIAIITTLTIAAGAAEVSAVGLVPHATHLGGVALQTMHTNVERECTLLHV